MFKCIDDLAVFLAENFTDGSKKDFSIIPDVCPPNTEGDLTVNCFRLAGELKQKPDAVAEKACGFLSLHPDVEKAERIKAFVNFSLKPGALFGQASEYVRKTLSEPVLEDGKRKKLLVEYSAPNTNKPMHLGHLRNNALGMALVSILKRAGHEVFSVNLINDRGIHICKSMIAYMRSGGLITPESAGKKGDHLVGDFYVMYDKELKKQLSELRAGKPELSGRSDEDLFLETELGAATQELLRKWESGDKDTLALWNMMNGWVLKGFDETYRRMGASFDKIYFESETYMLGKDIVMKGLRDGIFKKRGDGAVYVDLSQYKLGEKILLRSDGTSVYMTQDIGTTIRKYEDFRTDGQIWVVADEQIHHLSTLFAIMKLLGFKWAENLYHLAYGMVNLPTGKMKSREGTVVDADNLFDEMADLARNATLERCDGNIPGDIERRSEIISMGALKFMLLKYNPRTTIMFDPQASIKFEGDTGPYVQYVCARISSIMKKSLEPDGSITPDSIAVDWGVLGVKSERSVAVQLALYKNALANSAVKYDCSILAGYLLDLAKAFNTFYKECSVLGAENAMLRNARLHLCASVRSVLKDGLNTMTIDDTEAM